MSQNISLLTLIALPSLIFFSMSASADTSIVVNFGPYSSAQAAGNSEAEVDWYDADRTDDAVCTEAFAALELQRCLRIMTGRHNDFNIVDDDSIPEGELILIGSPAGNAAAAKMAGQLDINVGEIAKLGREGYRIKTATTDGRRITLIAGGGREGTLFGVYDLLHRLGCRWFSPAEFDEELPRAEWNPTFDATERPAFEVRGFYVWEKRGSPEFVLWMARNRLNLWTVHMDEKPLMRKLGLKLQCGTHDVSWRFISPKSDYPYDHPKFDGDENKPADPYPISDSFRGDADGNGKLSYFEAHAEWYPMVDGRRVPGVEQWSGVNFCTSNKDAVAEFTKNYVQSLIDGDFRGADVAEMWMLDVGKWCQCPRCKAAGTPTDRNLLVVHRFDKEIKKARREGRLNRPVAIRFLAYADVIEPPTRPLPDDFDYQTCTAAFFPITRCYAHNFDDPSCGRNAPFQKQLDGWIKKPDRHYRGQVCIGEYYNVSYFRSLPICFMHSMAADIPCYHRLGARQFHYMHATTARWGSKALTNYQMARQLWDADADCELLWRDYFQRRYGPAADVMTRFYASLEKMLINAEALKNNWHGFAGRLNRGDKNLFPDPHLQYRRDSEAKGSGPSLVEMVAAGEECRRLIDEALKMPAPDRIKSRLIEDERVFAYAERTLRYYDQCVRAFQLAWAGKKDEARPHYEEARRVADLLRRDTWATGACYKENFEVNGFNATFAEGALDQLAKLLDVPEKR
ncbi:MAG: DUF4838 domain-containing protein [Pirellulales bacterium]|nr:DUF4838 domain-containing protein [Pirellulales bacterium]